MGGEEAAMMGLVSRGIFSPYPSWEKMKSNSSMLWILARSPPSFLQACKAYLWIFFSSL